MFKFEVIQDLKPNDEILEIIKACEYTVKNGKIKHLKATNLQFIKPIEYLITYPSTLTIYEYKVRFKYILWFLIKVVKVKLKQDYLCNFI